MDILSSKELLAGLAILASLIGFVPYVRGILRGETKPHIFTWTIWASIMWIAFAAQISEGAGAGAWHTLVAGFMCLLIAIASIKRGEKNITRSDKISFGAALCAIPLWYFTQNPLAAVVLVTLIDLLGYYPTFRKSYHKPDEEVALAYFMAMLSFMFATSALETYNLTTALYPVTLIFANIALVAMLLWRRKVLG